MPFIIRKNKNEETYKVTNKETGKVYAVAFVSKDYFVDWEPYKKTVNLLTGQTPWAYILIDDENDIYNKCEVQMDEP